MALRRRFPLSQDDAQDDGYQPIGMGQRPTPVTPEPAPVFQQPQTSQPTDLRTQPVPYRPPQGTPAPTPYTPPAPRPTPGTAIPVSNPTASTPMNTDGYAAPAFIPKGTGSTMLGGYDPAKLADLNHQTPKYAVGRILSNFPDTPEGLRQALPDLQRAYPGVEIIGVGGKLDFRNATDPNIRALGIVDVGKAFGAGGGQGYQWDTGGNPGTPTVAPLMQENLSPIDQDSPVMRNAIMDLLEGQGQRPLRTAQYRRTEAM
jgi:hypothetical protein